MSAYAETCLPLSTFDGILPNTSPICADVFYGCPLQQQAWITCYCVQLIAVIVACSVNVI